MSEPTPDDIEAMALAYYAGLESLRFHRSTAVLDLITKGMGVTQAERAMGANADLQEMAQEVAAAKARWHSFLVSRGASPLP